MQIRAARQNTPPSRKLAVINTARPRRSSTATPTDPAMTSSSVNGTRRNSTWGLAVLVLTKCVAATHAVTLWNHRGNFQEYYRGSFGSKPKSAAGSSGVFGNIFANAETVTAVGECTPGSTSCAADPVIKGQSPTFVPRFSRLSKRFPLASDCCSDACRECLPPEAAIERCGDSAARSAILAPRGGHLSHNTGGALTGAAESIVSAAAEAVASPVTPFGLHLNIWKILFQIVLTTINVLCWLIPLRSKKISENKVALSLANAFSGGVFLSLAFGHLIPECVHGFHASLGGEMNEALPYMIILGGYLLIFFVEKVAFDAHDILHEMTEGGGDHGDKKEVLENGTAKESGGGHRGAVILLGALAVHSILEMTALGLADTFGDCALLSLSIALHQPAESIALLVAFLKSGMPKPEIARFLSIFSCMGPIGVAIGMVVNNFASPLVDASMLAVVAGTFIYVGATEVIPEEWEDSDRKWTKFAALISGIVSIFAITQYTMTLEGAMS